MQRDSVTYRLGTSGSRDVENTLARIAEAGDASARRLGQAYDRDLRVAEAAVGRLERSAERLKSLGGSAIQQTIAGNTGIGAAEAGRIKDAEASMRVFIQRQDELAQARSRLLSQFDPLYAAQQRYDASLAEANALQRQGAITAEELANVQARAALQLAGAREQHERVTKAVGAHTMGIQQLGFQASDFAVQMAGGTSAVRAFALQGPQMVQALALMGQEQGATNSKFAAFTSFLAGPWGAAITVAVSVIGLLATSMGETEEASDDLKGALDFQKMSHDQLAKAIADQRAEAEKSIETSYEQAEAARALAEQNLKAAISERALLAAQLERAEAARDLVNRQRMADGLGGAAAGGLTRGVGDLGVSLAEQRIAQNETNVRELERILRMREIPLVRRGIEAGNDPAARAKLEAEKAEAAIVRQYRDGKITREALIRELDLVADAEKRATQAAQEARKARERLTGTPGLSETVGADLTAAARRYMGLDENRGGDNVTLRNLFSEANIAIDPKMTAWCAAFVNAVLATEGLPGTGSLAARSFLEYGKAADDPRRGDIAVLRRGTGNQGHVGFFDGFDAAGNPILLSGNAGGGRAVTRQAFDKGDVLAYRRVGAPGAMLAEMEERLAEARKDNAASVRSLIEAGDPFAAIKNSLADTLAEIDRLAGIAPAQGGIGSEQADILRSQARVRASAERKDLFNEQFDTEFGKRQEERDRQSQAIAQLADQQRQENEQLDLGLKLRRASVEEREREYEQLRFIHYLTEQGLNLDDARVQALIRGNEVLLERAQAEARANALIEEQRRIGENIVDTLFDPSNWDDWGDMGKRIIQMLVQEMLVLAAVNPLKNQLFGLNLPTLGEGGIGGFLANLFGGAKTDSWVDGLGAIPGTGGQKLLPLDGWWKAFGNASGTEWSTGGWRRVGEFGEELVRLPRGAQVMNAGRTRQADRAARPAPVMNIDLRGAVMTEDLLRQMQAMASQAASEGAQRGAEGGFRAVMQAHTDTFGQIWQQ